MEGMQRGRTLNTSATTIMGHETSISILHSCYTRVWVMRLQLAFYIVATPGSSTSNGKITYIVMGNLILDYANQFFDQYLEHIGKLLIRFYQASSIAEVGEAFPHDLDQNTREVITTRWPFFTATRRLAIEETESGFPSCSIFKTSFQVLYNSLKIYFS
jgi:hypothetical protein